ncbi:MAG: DEAD/DEAH box helicase family protein [Proteobacteria bacterium]|nr:DEAD/DEAH box helicase family protein [Pseudomonadota bacterium]
MATDSSSTADALRAENARLVALLEKHGIDWRAIPVQVESEPAAEPSRLSTTQKVALFRRLFRGRLDTYPIRWESKASGKSGYAPACANEWKAGICEKPRIKCSDCGHRRLIPLSDAIIYAHLTGEHTIGVYPLLDDDTCHFLAVDFDEAEWREDARAFADSCRTLGVPVGLEISRSGKGAHAWIFFSVHVPARDARRLGTALISHACASTRQLKLTSYDRLFPNQDTLPKGGFGNLIALPLQKKPRESGYSVFVDEAWQPFSDQWAFLESIRPLDPRDIKPILQRALDGAHPLDVTFIEQEDMATPWKRPPAASAKLQGAMPRSLTVTLADRIYFEKTQLPASLANCLVRLAAFQNPEFYRAQAMRLSVWDKPRVIGCAENFPQHIALPRGCLDAVRDVLAQNHIELGLTDERYLGTAVDVQFTGTLRADQKAAVDAMLRHDIGVLSAPTAFGKTVVAASLVERRGVNTLVLVHRTELLKQWKERFAAFLKVPKGAIGTIGGGKPRRTGLIDIAVMQTLARKGELENIIETYGHVIIDECHHVGAASFDTILRRAKAKFVLGLTATPIRRDGQQPIIFMQCGPIRHAAQSPPESPRELHVQPLMLDEPIDLASDARIQDVFRHIASDAGRTRRIASAIEAGWREGRKILVLTERTDHLESIRAALPDTLQAPFLLHGRMSRKQRSTMANELAALAPDEPRILLATGKLVGEGFDHPPLDMLVLAMPISWKGTLQQYAGRLHREHAGKQDVRIIDVVDSGHPALLSMWGKRVRGYRAMGYRLTVAS